MSDNKTGIRWWIFNRFGPPEVLTLIDYIDKVSELTDGEIVIYPHGTYYFETRTSDGHQGTPLTFPTIQERAAFNAGLNYGVSLIGGQTQEISSDHMDAIDLMNKKSTHGGGGGFDA